VTLLTPQGLVGLGQVLAKVKARVRRS
jgi:hypothetical protein